MSTAVVNIQQAMQRTGKCRRTIYNWIAAGRLKVVRTASGRQMIVVASLYTKTEGRFGAERSPVPAAPEGQN